MKRVMIAGSRQFSSYEVMDKAIKSVISLRDVESVISGCAYGADKIGEQWAIVHHRPIEKHPALWNVYGKRAGYIRNVEMVNDADLVILFWNGLSKGTKHDIDISKELGKECLVFDFTGHLMMHIENVTVSLL